MQCGDAGIPRPFFALKKPAASPAKRVAAEGEAAGFPGGSRECYCTRLFQLERSLMELTPEERYGRRLERKKPVLGALLAWANAASATTAPEPALGKALHYPPEQWPYLLRCLEGRQAGTEQQPCRAQPKALCDGPEVGPCNTPAGARFSAVIYSLELRAQKQSGFPYRCPALAPAQRACALPDG